MVRAVPLSSKSVTLPPGAPTAFATAHSRLVCRRGHPITASRTVPVARTVLENSLLEGLRSTCPFILSSQCAKIA